jgi:CheY-like chemotaxis protein
VLVKAGSRDGAEALAKAREVLPVAVILEIPLGALCGYEVCRTLKADLGPQLVVIFLSGARIESYDRVAGLLLGADDYVTKPAAPRRSRSPTANSSWTRLARRLEPLRERDGGGRAPRRPATPARREGRSASCPVSRPGPVAARHGSDADWITGGDNPAMRESIALLHRFGGNYRREGRARPARPPYPAPAKPASTTSWRAGASRCPRPRPRARGGLINA